MTSLRHQIQAVTTALWEALGVDPSVVSTGPHARRHRRDNTACQDLPPEDRWIAYRTSELGGDLYDRHDLWTRGIAYLQAQGFEDIRRYRPQHDPETGPYKARATRHGLVVHLDVSANGATHIEVIAGPAAPHLTPANPHNFTPID